MRSHDQVVPLDRILLENTTYKITTRSGVDDLIPSITRQGVINAPILQPHGKQWGIVAGFRRIAACRTIQRSDVAARLLPSLPGTSPANEPLP